MNHLRRLLRAPAQLLSRLRRLDDVLDYAPNASSGATHGATSHATSGGSLHHRIREAGPVPIPGPWGFLTSGYFFGLFFMAFVLNRVQNIVVPPRHPLAFRNVRSSIWDGRGFWQAVLRSLFPLDLSSTSSRFLFRIPSLFLLLRASVIWTLILLQGAGVSVPTQTPFVGALNEWAAHKSMEDVCWTTFVSVCFALFVSSLTSGMEGLNTTSNSPFNLFGYSFTLYIYASPMTHILRPKGAASRPDVHVVFTMIIPLLQLTMTHCLEVKRQWARQRLIPTTICSLLSLVHFHIVMWYFPASYPLPTMVPNVVESFLITVTATTCALNALTQLLSNGAITKPLFGHTATLMPKWDEDFSVVLFRLGTASLEATSVAGYGNEVGGVTRPQVGQLASQAAVPFGESMVEISPSGFVSVIRGSSDSRQRIPYRRGLSNEIKNVKAGARNTEVWADTLVNVVWHRELGRFVLNLWRYLAALARLVWALARGRSIRRERRRDSPHHSSQHVREEHQGKELAETDLYERFLRGDVLSEDEDEDDEDFEPHTPDTRENTPFEEGGYSESEEDPHEETEEAVELFTDLSRGASSSASAPLLLAHMTNTLSSPLTRRKYAKLLRIPETEHMSSTSDDWTAFVQERRDAKRGRVHDDPAAENRQLCVICTAEPREIICWPCRCLALCDDCRENLASRASASKHLCPCCRTNVEGYSKIFIP